MHLIINHPRTKKWQLNLSRPSGSWVIDQNSILYVLIKRSRTNWHTEIWMLFLSVSDNFALSCLYFEIAAQNMLNFGLEYSSPLGLASKIVLSLDQIRSYLVTKSLHISNTHGESTQVSILERGRPNLASLSGLSPSGPMYQYSNRLPVPDKSQLYNFT